MIIKSAKFVMSNTDYRKCPPPEKPEYAFIGRSNVGKSSLINMLVNVKGLAKTSSTPGKTQLINHFAINDAWYLVDLPGYGYAKVSKVDRAKFEKMIDGYLNNRSNLLCTFVLIDVRHEPQTNDMNFMRMLGEKGIPFCIVFTKADKEKKATVQKKIDFYGKVMKQYWAELPKMFVTSSETQEGREEILTYINTLNESF
ncbi:MAG: ribosome biogenesis GTP-binding protein YihA/YsxC [Thermoflexibacteraceae bacterium]|jgi:GTP-binding protein